MRGDGDQRFRGRHGSFSPVALVRRERNEMVYADAHLLLAVFRALPPSAALSFLGDLFRISKSSSLAIRFLFAGLGSVPDALRSDPALGLRLLPDSNEFTGMNERGATCGYVVFLARVSGSKPGKSSRSVRRWFVWDLRLSAACDATRILSSPPSLRRAASSAISVSSQRRSSLGAPPDSIISVRV